MSIFITGATGFVGRHFLQYLVQTHPDFQICCLVRDPNKAALQWSECPPQVRWLQGDLLDISSFSGAVSEASHVFHIAALVSLRNGPEFYQMNTQATQNLLEALSGSKYLQRLVYVSSISAIDRPMDRPAVGPLTEETIPCPNTDYGKSKLEAEKWVIQSGLPYCILRPPYIFGPNPRPKSSMDRLIYDVKEQKSYTQLPFPGQASAIYVEDLAEMIWVAGQHPAAENETFFVANQAPVAIGKVYAQVASQLGIRHAVRLVDEQWMHRFRGLIYERQPENVLLKVLFEDAFYCSPDKWYREVQHHPRFGFEEGLARTIQWYYQNERL